MKNSHKQTILTVLLLCTLLLMVSGCTKRFVITTALEKPFELGQDCSIGEILDELPSDIKSEDKPSLEDIEKLKGFIVEELNKKNALYAYASSDETTFEVNGSILEFKKGSGALRFFIGFGAGNAKMITSLQLVIKGTGEVVFAGNFTSQVSDGLINGEEIFKQVAKDFAKQLHNQLKGLGVVVSKN